MILPFVILTIMIWFSNGKRMHYLEFPHDRAIPGDVEHQQHFAVMDNADLEELPNNFSICSSVHIEYNRDYFAHFVILKTMVKG